MKYRLYIEHDFNTQTNGVKRFTLNPILLFRFHKEEGYIDYKIIWMGFAIGYFGKTIK